MTSGRVGQVEIVIGWLHIKVLSRYLALNSIENV